MNFLFLAIGYLLVKPNTSICNLDPGCPMPRLLLRFDARTRPDGVSRRTTDSHEKTPNPSGWNGELSYDLRFYEHSIFDCGGIRTIESRFIFTNVVGRPREMFCFAPRYHVFLSSHTNNDTRKQSIHKDDRPTDEKKPSRKSWVAKTAL